MRLVKGMVDLNIFLQTLLSHIGIDTQESRGTQSRDSPLPQAFVAKGFISVKIW